MSKSLRLNPYYLLIKNFSSENLKQCLGLDLIDPALCSFIPNSDTFFPGPGVDGDGVISVCVRYLL